MSDYLGPRDPEYRAAMQMSEIDIQRPPPPILYNAATAGRGNSFALNALLQSPNVNINLTPDPTTLLSSPELVQVTGAWKPVDDKFDRLKQRARRLEGCAKDDAQELQDKEQRAFEIRAKLEFAAGAAERSGRDTDVDAVKRWLELYKDDVENFEVTVDRVADLMPPDLNELYVRPGVFSIMEDKLLSEGTAALMMYGGPGLGKSALGRQLWQRAAEASRLHEQFPHGVIHIEFGRGPEEELPQKKHLLRKLGELEMKLDKEAASRQNQNATTDAPASEVEARVKRVLTALRQLLADGKRRLLIMDDVWPAQARMLRAGGLLSRTFKGKCVVLSRESMAHVMEGGAEDIKLQNEASACEAILAAHAYGNKDESELKPEHKAWGKNLLDRCGGQPLMIRLIASMLRDEMHERGRDATVWRMVHNSLEGRLSALLPDGPGGTDAISDNYSNPMAAYELSLSAVDADCKCMLRMMTLFPHSRRIPAGALLAVWHGSTGSKAGFSRALRTLQRKCILDVLPHNTPTGTDDVRMHALLRMYLARFTAPLPLSAPVWTRLKTLWTGLLDAEAICTPSTALHSYLHAVGRNHEALVMAERVVGIKERVIGAEHPDTLTSKNNVAVFLGAVGRNDDALVMAERVLGIRERVIGAEHPSTLDSVNNVAVFLGAVGRNDEALVMAKRVHGIRERVIGAEHPDTLTSMSNVAVCLGAVGRNDEALVMAERVLGIRERVIGAEHPKTLASMSIVAVRLGAIGRIDDALVMAERVLGIRERVIGAEHPDTLTSMGTVAAFLGAVGRNEEALVMAERVLGIRERVIGAEHPSTLTSMSNVAVRLSAVGRNDEALVMAEQLLGISERVIGAEHPKTLASMNNVAHYLGAVGRNHDALVMAERVRVIRRSR